MVSMPGVDTIGGATIVPRIRGQFGMLYTRPIAYSIQNLRRGAIERSTAVQPKMKATNNIPVQRYALGDRSQKGALKNG